jgi:hypothetical protein
MLAVTSTAWCCLYKAEDLSVPFISYGENQPEHNRRNQQNSLLVSEECQVCQWCEDNIDAEVCCGMETAVSCLERGFFELPSQP